MNKRIYFVLSALVFIFLVMRAIYVPLVHDELATFFYYIQPFEYNPLTGANPDANNHILNSFLGAISHNLFGYSALSFRLPNVLSFVFYAFFVFKIGEKLRHEIPKWAFYIALLFGIYFIQFFALSRGYGMSMAFLIGSIYYTLCLYEKPKFKLVLFNSLFLILGLFANMALLPLVLLLFLIQILLIWKKIKLDCKIISLALISIGFIGLAIVISLKMKEEGSLYYGELDGYWEVTVKSQLLMLFENSGKVLQVVLGVLLLGFITLYGFLFKKEKKEFIFKKENLFLILLVGVVIGTFLMAQILKVNYPEDRVGLYLYTLLVGVVCFGVDRIKAKWSYILLLPLFVMPLHFAAAFNFDKVSVWQGDNIPDRFYEEIVFHKTGTKYPATVGGSIQRVFVYEEKVYKDTTNQNQLAPFTGELEDGKYYDYLITNSKHITSITHLYDSIDVAEISGHALFKRKERVKLSPFYSAEKHADSEQNDEYFEFMRQDFDSIETDGLMIGLDIELQSMRHPLKSQLVVEVKDKATGEQLSRSWMHLNWLSPMTVRKNPLIKSFYLHNFPNFKEVEVIVYLWNIDKQPFTVYKGEVEVFKVIE
ncbi:MAG: hypothetical protein ABF242_00755 [Flavobacteriales bacterium]